MKNATFNDEWVKSVSKDDFAAFCAAHPDFKDWDKVDVEGYYNKCNPQPEKPAKDDTKRRSNTATATPDSGVTE